MLQYARPFQQLHGLKNTLFQPIHSTHFTLNLPKYDLTRKLNKCKHYKTYFFKCILSKKKTNSCYFYVHVRYNTLTLYTVLTLCSYKIIIKFISNQQFLGFFFKLLKTLSKITKYPFICYNREKDLEHLTPGLRFTKELMTKS